MRDKMKKILGLALATVSVTSVFAGCKTTKYKGDPIDGYVSEATVNSNGGFAVEKGDYVYFINGQEQNSADNKYGAVEKGALMRISKADLAAGKNTAITVVPSLFVAQNMKAGIWIYDNYVYYATPTTDKNLSGDVEYTYIDFKRAKLDGSAGPEKYFARTSDNTANYRFVEAGYGEEKSVYCLYEEKLENGKTALKSVNAETGDTTVLVVGASQYFYDTKDMENGDVYYTMDVTFNADSDNSIAANYNQIYRVNAAATAKVDAKNAKYTVYNGTTKVREYDFNETYMKAQNDEAEKDQKPYDFKDYSTYPYVNLGTIVLDGIGQENVNENVDNRFVWDTDVADRYETSGYKYTLQSYQGEALYFTRTAVATTQSDGTDAKLYYLADSDVQSDNSVGANDGAKFKTVALNTANTANAAFYAEGEKQYYIYFTDDGAYRAGYDNESKSVISEVKLLKKDSGETTSVIGLDETNKYFYYYSGSGSSVSRVKYDGAEDDYNRHLSDEPAKAEYQKVAIPGVVCNTAWYAPEFDIGGMLLYSAAQSYGNDTTTYNYIHAAKLGTNADIKAAAELYEDVQTAMTEITDAKVADVARYYYRTGVLTAYETAKATYEDKYTEKQVEKINAFVDKFKADAEFENAKESNFITLIGKVTDEDEEAQAAAWTDYFAEETDEEESKGLPAWAIVLICVGGALVVAAAVTIPLVIVGKKKKQAQMEADATVNAYKRKLIDTTDDKTIDVYADEEVTEETTEVAQTEEEVVEETTEEPAPAEEVAPVEETTEEPAPVEEVAPVEENTEEPAPAEEVAPVEENTEEPAPVEESKEDEKQDE